MYRDTTPKKVSPNPTKPMMYEENVIDKMIDVMPKRRRNDPIATEGRRSRLHNSWINRSLSRPNFSISSGSTLESFVLGNLTYPMNFGGKGLHKFSMNPTRTKRAQRHNFTLVSHS